MKHCRDQGKSRKSAPVQSLGALSGACVLLGLVDPELLLRPLVPTGRSSAHQPLSWARVQWRGHLLTSRGVEPGRGPNPVHTVSLVPRAEKKSGAGEGDRKQEVQVTALSQPL